MSATDRMNAAIWEADRHVETLLEAIGEWDRSPVSSWEALETDRARVRVIDQLLFRFMKLQDTVSERLTPATLVILREPFEEWPMRDRLNRLEKLGYLDVENWLSWREIRNRLAHEYPDQPEIRFAALVAAIEAARALAALYQEWRTRLNVAGRS